MTPIINAAIIADSVNPHGCRLTTWILEFPRFILAELATHRVFSKNAASSRAIPIEKVIQQIVDKPAVPVKWGSHNAGMQSGAELDGNVQGRALELWLQARDRAIETAKQLNDLGLHKSVTNRLLEPWFTMRVILSGTEFENFFALRAHPDAQPEFQALAYKMLEVYNVSEPKPLKPGQWHIPFGDKIDQHRVEQITYAQLALEMGAEPGEQFHIENVEPSIETSKLKIAIARCARVSYFNFEGKDDYAADIKLCDRLFGSVPRHLSPTEHVAQCMNDDSSYANFRGWKQYRLTFDDQNLSDPRVVKKGIQIK